MRQVFFDWNSYFCYYITILFFIFMQLLQSLPDCYLTDHHFFHSHLWSCSHTLSALPCSFPEKLMKPWSNGMHEPGIITPARFFRIVREIRILGDGGNHIHAPAVHTLIHPEFHKVIDLPAHSPIFPVKVRLLLITKVQVILSPCPVISLGAAAEAGPPVIRLSSFGSFQI